MSKIPTGIPGFDELAAGGFADRTVNIVAGPAGSAKTLFSMQYLFNGAANDGEVGLYLTLEESRDNLKRAMANFGMDLDALEQQEKLFIVDMGKLRLQCNINEEKEYDLIGFQTLMDFLKSYLSYSKATRMVLDSVTAVGLYYNSMEDLRSEMFKFSRFLKENDVTSILITEIIPPGVTRYGIEEFVGDSFISMDYEAVEGEYRRTVTIKTTASRYRPMRPSSRKRPPRHRRPQAV
jgi:circadian clock protein KaiC